jgi:hypothetical protein
MTTQTKEREETAFDRLFDYIANNGYTAVLYGSPEKHTADKISSEKIYLAESKGWNGRGDIPLTENEIQYIEKKVEYFNECFGGVGWIFDRNPDSNWETERRNEFNQSWEKQGKTVPRKYLN